MNRKLPMFLALLCLAACNNKTQYRVVTTYAGTGIMGHADGVAAQATFGNAMALAVDTSGNIYLADSHNNLIRKINTDGIVTTLAGSGQQGQADGKGAAATFFSPEGIAVGKNGVVYVADTHNSLIRKITPDGMVTTVAGQRIDRPVTGKDSTVKFDNPVGIAVDDTGNIYVADWNNDVIHKITPAGRVTKLAGGIGPGLKNAQGDSALFYLPRGITLDSANNLYVADSYNNIIRKVTPAGVVTTVAGKQVKGKAKGSTDGPAAVATFFRPAGVALDKQGNILVADMGSNKIRKITPGGMVGTVAGNGKRALVNGRDTAASFFRPYSVAVDKGGNIYVADYGNNVVRKIAY